MLQNLHSMSDGASHKPPRPMDEELSLDFDRIFQAFARQYKIVMLGALGGLVLGILFLLNSETLYSSQAQILIDDRQVRYEDGDSGLQIRFDASKIDSQVAVLQSVRIARAVVESLKLYDDPAFLPSNEPTTFQRLSASAMDWAYSTGLLGEREDTSAVELAARKAAAVAEVTSNLRVGRLGLTYVLNVGYTARTPALAAAVANGIADAYLNERLEAKYDATKRATAWLQSRVDELKSQSIAADQAVLRYKEENNIVAAEGVLLNESQLADLSAQLTVARAATAQAVARYDQINAIVESGEPEAAVSEMLSSPVIATLRAKYLDAAKRYADISSKLGTEHIQAVKFRGDMDNYQKAMFSELVRVAESYRSEMEIARAKERSLEESLSSLAGRNASLDESLIRLRDLEREADTYRNLHQTFLQRYQETIQQQSFPITEARIISPAEAPKDASHPRKALILAAALALGCLFGGGIGAIREWRDRGIRTGDQVRERLGLEFLGLAPLLSRGKVPAARRKRGDARVVMATNAAMRHTIDAPMSAFSETLRVAKLSADVVMNDRRCKTVGVTSVRSGEGKSTISKNFASMLATLGARTILIDCDLRNPGASDALAPNAVAGLAEVLLGEAPLSAALLTEPESGLVMLPVTRKRRFPHTSELLSSRSMKALLEDVEANFDYVILDLPPIGPVVDTRAIADRVESYLFVVEWGMTTWQAVWSSIAYDQRIKAKCLGVILNKVDLKALRYYDSMGSEGYLPGGYSKYYQGDAPAGSAEDFVDRAARDLKSLRERWKT